MIRKVMGACIAMGLFFSLTLGAAASPLSTTAVSNTYTQNEGTQGGPDPEAISALAGAFALGVVSGVAANVVYDIADLDRIDKDRMPDQFVMSPSAETLLDN